MVERDVRLTLTEEQTTTLLGLIDTALGEFTSEIANTDNAAYRASLGHRRDVIRDVRELVDAAAASHHLG